MKNDQSELHPDKISNLPENVMEIILCCLPTLDAARTSILSKNWRHAWSKIPKVVLDETFWENVCQQHSARVILTKILCQVLLCHDGPIKEFKLSNPNLSSCPEIDNLILFFANRDLEYFNLEMWEEVYLLPQSFFSCQKLTKLKLRGCAIRSSPIYDGFSMLTTLDLRHVAISAKTLASLISGSPLLSYLGIKSCSEVDICIDAPNLRTFSFCGYTKSMNFKRTPVLTNVLILKNNSEETINFHLFPVVESLMLNSFIFQDFESILQPRLPTPLIYLKEVSLYEVSFNDSGQLSFILCLLRSSPTLKRLYIEFEDECDSNSEDTTKLMEEEDYSDMCLNELLQVKLEGFMGTKQELEFIKILLAKSSSLKKFEIQPNEDLIDNKLKIVKEVLKFRRISKDAEVIFEE